MPVPRRGAGGHLHGGGGKSELLSKTGGTVLAPRVAVHGPPPACFRARLGLEVRLAKSTSIDQRNIHVAHGGKFLQLLLHR